MKQIEIKFTPVELDHICGLLAMNDDNGIHTRPMEQYWARAKRIKDKISAALSEHRVDDK